MTKPLGRSRERTVLLLSFWSVMYKLINPFYLDTKRKLCCQIFVFLQGGGVLRGSRSHELSFSKSRTTGLLCNSCMTIYGHEENHIFAFFAVLLLLYGEDEHATTWKFYALCYVEIDCSWFMETYLFEDCPDR